MKITEQRLRSIIRSVIKEQNLNEMMDPHGLSMHDMKGAESHGSFFDIKVPRNKRKAEKLIRQGLLKIYELNEGTPMLCLTIFPLLGAELINSLPGGAAISLGVYILSLFTNKYILKRLGFEEIDTSGEISTTVYYLNKRGYREKEYIPEKAIDKVLDQQGY